MDDRTVFLFAFTTYVSYSLDPLSCVGLAVENRIQIIMVELRPGEQ